MFEVAERGTDVIRSVTLLHQRYDRESPLLETFDVLGQPLRTEAPAPNSAFVKEWYGDDDLSDTITTEPTVANLFLFENAKSAQKLEVFAWTLEEVGHGQPFLHYAFLLQVVDM